METNFTAIWLVVLIKFSLLPFLSSSYNKTLYHNSFLKPAIILYSNRHENA
jgi:hypothetical protein